MSLIREEETFMLHEEFCGNLVNETILHYYRDVSTSFGNSTLFQDISSQLFMSFNTMGSRFF